MPRIEKLYTLEITPERFLDACDGVELQELEVLLQSPRYRKKMNPTGLFRDQDKIPADSRQLRIPD